MNNNYKSMSGCIVALPTPFTGKAEIDYESVNTLSDYIVKHSLDGILVAGTVGEGILLSYKEKKALFKATVDRVNGRIAVFTQCGVPSIGETVDLCTYSKEIGADGAVILTPYFYPLDSKAIKQYYLSVAKQVRDIPIYIYNIPSHTSNDIDASVLEDLARLIPNLGGLKYSDGDLAKIARCIQSLGNKSVLIGCDTKIVEAFRLGVKGMVSGNASAFPESFVNLIKAKNNGDLGSMQKKQEEIRELLKKIEEMPYVPVFKNILVMKHVIENAVCRSPWRNLETEEYSRLRDVYSDYYRNRQVHNG